MRNALIYYRKRLHYKKITRGKMGGSSVNAKISLIALVAISIIIGRVDAKPPRKIVGGEDAEVNEFPWMARLHIMDQNGANFVCGGAIISPRHILTAGHCLYRQHVQKVWTGFYIRDINMDVESFVAHTIVHPLYSFHVHNNSTYIHNDIGIVTLVKDLELDGTFQKIIPLADTRTTVGTHAVLSGWGYDNEAKTSSPVTLQKTSILIRPINECWEITPMALCGASPPHATPCNGDSGSPLVVDGRAIGLLSTGRCLVGRESTYASVYDYLTWIRSVISAENQVPAAEPSVRRVRDLSN